MTNAGIIIDKIMTYIVFGPGLEFIVGCWMFTLIGYPIILLNKSFKERKR